MPHLQGCGKLVYVDVASCKLSTHVCNLVSKRTAEKPLALALPFVVNTCTVHVHH